MSTHKYIDVLCVVVIVLAVLLTVLFMNGAAFGIETIVDEDAESYTGSEYFTTNDKNASWDTSNATAIVMSGTECNISGNGAYFYNGNVVISNAGYYVLSGSLSDGSVVVDADSSSKVWILFDGVELTCSNDAAFRIDQADKVFVTLAKGSSNTIESGSEYSAEALADGAGGAVFARDDLTVNGSGKLTITGQYKHGIDANDDLVIAGGDISIQAVKDGIHANDSVRIREASVTLDVQDDAIAASKEENGYVYIESGTLMIQNCYEGIEAPVIRIDGGDTTIYSSDDGLNANGSGSQTGMGGMPAGNGGGMGFGNDNAASGGPVRSGNFGGRRGDNDVASRGAVDFKEAGERPGGFGSASGGAAMPDNSSQSASGSEDEETYIDIRGGTLTIINETGRDADGLDSNGDIKISGGTIRISLTNGGSNSAIDYASENNGVCEITGGTVVACGSSGMAESFSSTSSQCALLYNFDGAEAGTSVSLSDTNGNEILSYDVPCSYNSVNLSAPELKQGQTYRLTIDGNTTEVTQDEISVTLGTAESGRSGGMGNRGGAFGNNGAPGVGQNRGMVSGTAVSGGVPDFQMPQEQMQGQMQEEETGDDAGSATAVSVSELSANVWIYLAIAFTVLLGGILFAVFYRRK